MHITLYIGTSAAFRTHRIRANIEGELLLPRDTFTSQPIIIIIIIRLAIIRRFFLAHVIYTRAISVRAHAHELRRRVSRFFVSLQCTRII